MFFRKVKDQVLLQKMIGVAMTSQPVCVRRIPLVRACRTEVRSRNILAISPFPRKIRRHQSLMFPLPGLTDVRSFSSSARTRGFDRIPKRKLSKTSSTNIVRICKTGAQIIFPNNEWFVNSNFLNLNYKIGSKFSF